MKKTTGRRSVLTTVVAGAAVPTMFGTGPAVTGRPGIRTHQPTG